MVKSPEASYILPTSTFLPKTSAAPPVLAMVEVLNIGNYSMMDCLCPELPPSWYKNPDGDIPDEVKCFALWQAMSYYCPFLLS